jgi:hypothetical protein
VSCLDTRGWLGIVALVLWRGCIGVALGEFGVVHG